MHTACSSATADSSGSNKKTTEADCMFIPTPPAPVVAKRIFAPLQTFYHHNVNIVIFYEIMLV